MEGCFYLGNLSRRKKCKAEHFIFAAVGYLYVLVKIPIITSREYGLMKIISWLQVSSPGSSPNSALLL